MSVVDDDPPPPELPPLAGDDPLADELPAIPESEDGAAADDYPGSRLPQNLEAEQALLGGLLLSPGQFDLIDGRLDADDFFAPANGVIFEALLALRQRGSPFDPVLLRDELARRGELDRVGGAMGLAALTGMAASGAHVEHYARVVREKSLLRRLIAAATDILRQASLDAAPAADIIDAAERSVLNVTERNIQSDAQPVSNVIEHMWGTMFPVDGQPVESESVPTGYMELDQMLTGLHPGELVILAARPSVGKTTFSLNILRNAVMRHGVGAVFFSLEMSAENIARHLIVAESMVSAQKFRHRALSKAEMQKLDYARNKLVTQGRLWIDDTPAISLGEMRGKARRLENKHKIKLVVVDYLQLMSASSQASKRGREQEVSELSRGLKALAKELRVPVISLAQLSRKPEGRPDGKPILSDLRESGAIEQDADVVMMLHRPEKREEGDPDEMMELVVAKQRNGPTGTVKLLFRRDILRFDPLAFNTDPAVGQPAAPASSASSAPPPPPPPFADDDGF